MGYQGCLAPGTCGTQGLGSDAGGVARPKLLPLPQRFVRNVTRREKERERCGLFELAMSQAGKARWGESACLRVCVRISNLWLCVFIMIIIFISRGTMNFSNHPVPLESLALLSCPP